MDEAGVWRDVAMAISGHKTQAMYSRYNIADVKRKHKALELAQEFRERMAAEEAQESNVVAMRADPSVHRTCIVGLKKKKGLRLERRKPFVFYIELVEAVRLELTTFGL